MDDRFVIRKYSELMMLTQDQITMLESESLEIILEAFQEKEAKKEVIKEEIEQVGQVNLTPEYDSELKEAIQNLIQQNNRLLLMIETTYTDESKEQKNVSNQRKTIKAYGRLYNSDVVPLYFDEKQ